MLDELETKQLNAFNKILNAGAAQASQALSQMAGKEISVTFPKVSYLAMEKIPAAIGDPQEVVATVYLKVGGCRETVKFDFGGLVLMFPRESAIQLSAMLLMEEPDISKEITDLSEMDVSALKEAGNILTGSCLRAISDFLDFSPAEYLPYFATDMLQATLDHILITLAPKAEKSLLFTTELKVEQTTMQADFAILFDPEALSLFLEKLS